MRPGTGGLRVNVRLYAMNLGRSVVVTFAIVSSLTPACVGRSEQVADQGAGDTSGRGGGAPAFAGSGGAGGARPSGGAVGAGGSPPAGAAGGSSSGAHPLEDFLNDAAFPDTFWTTASLEESQIDPAPLVQAVELIERSGWEIHSFLIARNGRLVFEHYGWKSGSNPYDPDKAPHQVVPSERHIMFSATKSVLSALVGIALEDGSLTSLEQTIPDWFPDYAALNADPRLASITLENLLTMRSGLQFTEGEQGTFEAPDPARAMLARPLVDLPIGSVWNYSSGGSDVVAEILRVATGQTPSDYANGKLFTPIGIENPAWAAGLTGTSHGGWGLSLTSREMARFGELFRNSGSWGGQQVVPAAWTDASTMARCMTTWGGQYAYHWWVPPLAGFFNTLGAFGQVIYVSRATGLVIVFTADLPNETANSIFQQLIRDYVVPATKPINP